MRVVTVHEAKTNLSKLIAKVCRGEEVIIARGASPVVRLVPVGEVKGRRQPGALRGKLQVGPKFFEPLPAEGSPASWQGFFELMKNIDVPEDFLADRQDAPPQKRKLF
jgi:prevent-host-death family protein